MHEGEGELTGGVFTLLNAHAVALAEVRRDVADLLRTVSLLSKHLVEGNGQDSIITRMALQEQAVKGLETTIHTAAESLREVNRALEQRAAEEQKGKWQLLATVVSGLFSLAAIAFTAIMALRK